MTRRIWPSLRQYKVWKVAGSEVGKAGHCEAESGGTNVTSVKVVCAGRWRDSQCGHSTLSVGETDYRADVLVCKFPQFPTQRIAIKCYWSACLSLELDVCESPGMLGHLSCATHNMQSRVLPQFELVALPSKRPKTFPVPVNLVLHDAVREPKGCRPVCVADVGGRGGCVRIVFRANVRTEEEPRV